MAISNSEWREIEHLINRLLTNAGEAFVQGQVVKRDTSRKVVWLKEFGDTPIPLIAFNYTLKYYDTNELGVVRVRTAKAPDIEIEVPKVGETVLIAQHFGSQRLPKCLGVIKSKKYIQVESD